jgi:hypothetical protein
MPMSITIKWWSWTNKLFCVATRRGWTAANTACCVLLYHKGPGKGSPKRRWKQGPPSFFFTANEATAQGRSARRRQKLSVFPCKKKKTSLGGTYAKFCFRFGSQRCCWAQWLMELFSTVKKKSCAYRFRRRLSKREEKWRKEGEENTYEANRSA